MHPSIISADWLAENLTKKELIILDASPAATVQGRTSDYHELAIPKARIFNIKERFIDKTGQFPNTIPTPSQFEKECQLLGINVDSEIVVYDNLGVYTSPRVWWLFKVMGHENVKVLDGGLGEWVKQGYETFSKLDLDGNFPLGNFKSNFKSAFLIHFEDILKNITSKEFLVVDARSEGRFKGIAPEPRKHLKSGSIPGSINIPYTDLLENGKFKSKNELKQIFESKVTVPSKLVFSCGSGMTACIVMLASEVAFEKSNYLYDGSWTEYAQRAALDS